METEVGSFHFPELGVETRGPEMLSSWLDLEETYAPCFAAPGDSLPDFQMLDDDLFQFADSVEAFVLDSGEGGGTQAPPVTSDGPLHPTNGLPAGPSCSLTANDSDVFLADDIYLIAPPDNFSGETLLGSALASTSTTTAAPTSSTTCSSSENVAVVGGASSAAFLPVTSQEEEGDETDNEVQPRGANCKNLVSERNRRKRLSQQLLALRALVPNITKMDKRSVLVDALAYLRSIHEETARIQAELKERARVGREPAAQSNPDPDHPQPSLVLSRSSRPKAQILEIDTEKIEEKRFVVKITCKGEFGVGGEVLRVIESLGFEITYTSVDQFQPHHVLTTVFIRVRRQGRMTEEKLKDCITSTALRSGLTLHNP